MRDWIAALRRETAPSLVGVFSLASTIITFFPSLGFYRFRWIALVCLACAFGWANFRVYTKQRNTINNLQQRIAESGQKRANLSIRSNGDSTFIPIGHASVTDISRRIYVELNSIIENKGSRASNVVKFDFYAAGSIHPDLKPTYPRDVQGRRCNWGLAGTGLGANGHITIEAEKVVSGNIGFFVSFTPKGDFANLSTSLEPFVGTLVITDTEGVSASLDFHLTER